MKNKKTTTTEATSTPKPNDSRQYNADFMSAMFRNAHPVTLIYAEPDSEDTEHDSKIQDVKEED